MSHESQAYELLTPDPVANADLLDVLRRGAGQVLAADDRGVLLRDAGSRAYMMTSTSPAAAQSLLDQVIDPPVMVTHQEFSLPLIAERFGFDRATPCHQSAFLGSALPVVERPDLRVQSLGPDWAETLAEQYSLKLGVGHLRRVCAAGDMYGAFRGDTLVGFIGQHAEGSMGMLEVYPDYRRQGIAEYLVTWLGNRIIARGLVPFDQIIVGNTASERLQRKLGFTISPDKLYWTALTVAE